MKFLFGLIFTTVLLVSKSHAGIIFATGDGPFGSTTCCSSTINNEQFIGTTFSLAGKTSIDGIGGHFRGSGGTSGGIFGAIVSLNESGFPGGSLTSLDNVLAYAVFDPLNSVDTFVSVNLELDAGFYGLVFGSGLFGASGKSALTLIQPHEVSHPKGDIVFINDSTDEWMDAEARGRFRMFVSGVSTEVSEPSSLILVLMSFAVIFLGRRKQTV